MSPRFYVHIGLGKCSTTTLQMHIFPEICKKFNLNYVASTTQLNNQKEIDFINNLNFDVTKKEFKNHFTKDNYFISHEDLLSFGSGWNPGNYEKILNFLSNIFPSESHILLTIREPKNWLVSNYFQMLSEGKISTAESFYLNDSDYKKSRSKFKFDIDNFNYDKLAEMINKKFRNFTIIKYEEIGKMNFINQLNLGDINDEFLLKLKSIYNNKFEKKKNSDLFYCFMLILNQICNNKFFTVYDYRIKIHSIIKKYKYLKYPFILFDPVFLFKKLLNPLGFFKIKKFLKGEILKKIYKSNFYSQFYKQ